MNIFRLNSHPAAHNDALHVAKNMREWDAREIYATMWEDSPEWLVGYCMAHPSHGFVCGDSEPIAVIGAVPLWPNVFSMYMFATDKFHNISLPLTKWAKRVYFPALKDIGVARLQCHTMEGHVEAQKWLEFLGGSRESTHLSYGRNGETFHLYSWIRK
jgi:hypothetical protein